MTKIITIKGEWFLPTSKDNRIHGTLTYNPIEGSTLELYGSLEGDAFFPEYKNHELILGLSSDSKQIVLYNCMMTSLGSSTFVQGQESGKSAIEYSAMYILVGLHVDSINELKFDKISSEIFNLGEWVGISGFKNQPLVRDISKRPGINISYELPEAIKFAIDKETDGCFNFSTNSQNFSRYHKSVSINQKVEFQASTKTEKNIVDLLSYVITFQNFLILALYRSTYPLSITLSGERHKENYGDNVTPRKKIKLYFSTSNFKINEKPKFDIEMIFCYRDIREKFPILIKNWYKKYEILEPAFDLVFEQFYNENRFSTNTFLNLAQSAETFHSRVHSHTRIPKLEYKTMKDEILELVPNKYHKWLSEQFNFGNSLNLHARLTEIVERYSNVVLDKILDDKELFVLQVKHSRNYYTHYSNEGKKKALTGSKLFYLSEKIKLLLVCSFLMEIGFEKDDLTKSLDFVKRRMFNHLAN